MGDFSFYDLYNVYWLVYFHGAADKAGLNHQKFPRGPWSNIKKVHSPDNTGIKITSEIQPCKDLLPGTSSRHYGQHLI